MPPPTSGGVAVLQILKLLEPFDLAALKSASPQDVDARAIHLIAEASRLAFADRGRFLADSDFVAVPLEALLDPAYLAARARLIDPTRSMGEASPGLPSQQAQAPRQPTPPSTSHLSVVDAPGNATSMTPSLEVAFGPNPMARAL